MFSPKQFWASCQRQPNDHRYDKAPDFFADVANQLFSRNLQMNKILAALIAGLFSVGAFAASHAGAPMAAGSAAAPMAKVEAKPMAKTAMTKEEKAAAKAAKKEKAAAAKKEKADAAAAKKAAKPASAAK